MTIEGVVRPLLWSAAIVCGGTALGPARAAGFSDAPLRGSDSYDYANPDTASDVTIEVGARVWISSGKIHKDLNGRIFPGLVSRLSYDKLDAWSGEIFAHADFLSGFFAKGYAGFGQIGRGKLHDEDFPPVTAPYSNTLSRQKKGNLGYASIDYGYNVLSTPDYKLGIFAGYHYLGEKVNAYGCVQTAAHPVCAGSDVEPESTKVITETTNWHSARLGVSGEVTYDRLKISAEAAWVPYTYLDAKDRHWLRWDLAGAVPETGHGSGVQLEAVASYRITDDFTLGAGWRYWKMDAKGDAKFGAATRFGSDQPVKVSTERSGMFLQGTYRFGS